MKSLKIIGIRGMQKMQTIPNSLKIPKKRNGHVGIVGIQMITKIQMMSQEIFERIGILGIPKITMIPTNICCF